MNETSKIRPGRIVLTALCLIACFALAPSAGAVSRASYSMEILIDGIPLEEYAARGATYIEAREGREYSIRLRNHTGQRVAVALSVDGLNTIDAKTTKARDGRKWILGPWQTITLDGWQTSHSDARRFYFTTEEDSYGAWLGKTKNLGVISAAFFREKRPPRPVPIQSESRMDSGRREPSAPAQKRAKCEEMLGESEAGAGLSDEYAATGIGRKVDHRVRQVKFDAERNPAAVMEVRYEYHDALVRLGVLPRHYAHRDDPLSRRERAHGFDDIEFAPDPFK
jgi:hypothetical protein